MSIHALLLITIAKRAYYPRFVYPATSPTLGTLLCLYLAIRHNASEPPTTAHCTHPSTSEGHPSAAGTTSPATWQESWAHLQVALQTYGIAHILDAPEKLDPIAVKCIRFIGADDATLLTDTPEARSYYKRVFAAFRRADELAQRPYTPFLDDD